MELKYRDLIDLILSEPSQPEEIMNNLYEWKYKVDMFFLQVSTGISASLIVALIYNYDTLIISHPAIVYLLYVALIFLAIWLVQLYRRVKRNKDLFIASIKNYHNLKKYLDL
ncbi:MAG: hypothetical protein NT038_06060 [Euryarchaeota archaeon]|nr:hypothetical protein [Euryarchaeota archaeon]